MAKGGLTIFLRAEPEKQAFAAVPQALRGARSQSRKCEQMSLSSGSSSSGRASPRRPVFVLVGGTGDLAMRMLWPSLAMQLTVNGLAAALRNTG